MTTLAERLAALPRGARLPLSEDGEQLEQEDAQLGIGRPLAHLGLQRGKRRGRIAGGEVVLGGGLGVHVGRISSWKLKPEPRWPVDCCSS